VSRTRLDSFAPKKMSQGRDPRRDCISPPAKRSYSTSPRLSILLGFEDVCELPPRPTAKVDAATHAEVFSANLRADLKKVRLGGGGGRGKRGGRRNF
jgi:hypothetical protein